MYFFGGKGPRLTRSSGLPGEGTRLSTILLVEDTIANRAPAVKSLKAASHEVIQTLAAGFDGNLSQWIDGPTFTETVSRVVGGSRG